MSSCPDRPEEAVVRLLAQIPELYNSTSGLEPVFRMALRANRVDVVRAVLNRPNVDLEAEDDDGFTALQWACKFGNVAAVV